jgi:predicted dehydrogenase
MLKGVELAFVADADVALATRLGVAHGVPGITDPTPLLPTADAVVICTPTITHTDYVRTCAEFVSNIFVEKPLADTLGEAKALAEFSAIRQLNVQVGFIERFNPAVQGLRNILGRSERVISIDFTRTNKVSTRITDVDVVTDLMIHDIDLALYLNGPAKSVAAHGFVHNKMIDFASALISHDNGRFSRIQASRITEKKMRTIEVTCTDMFVDCDLLRKEIIISAQSETFQSAGQPYTISAVQQAVEIRPQEALLCELQAFVTSCCGERAEGAPSLSDSVSAMIVCEQVQKAILG